MGVITLALIANGNLGRRRFDVPTWVVVSAATAIALGTYIGGWRIIKTMGSRIIKMDPAQGFAAQGAGAAVILAASHFGYPLSTTHVISGARDGRRRGQAAVGRALGRRRQHRRRVGADAAGRGARSAASSTASRALFGDGAAGPVIVAAAGIAFTVVRVRAPPAAGRRDHDDRRGDQLDERRWPRRSSTSASSRRSSTSRWSPASAVSLAFSLVIRGAVRAGEHRRTRPVAGRRARAAGDASGCSSSPPRSCSASA